jgi:hypothetical protein
MSRVSRGVAVAVAAWIAGAASLVAIDLSTTRARLAASDPWAAPLLHAFGGLDPEIGSRIARGDSELRLPGFPAGAPVTLDVRLSTARRRPFEATLWINDRPAGLGRVRASPETIVARGVADERGDVRLRFAGLDAAPAVHFYGLDATWQGRGVAALRAPLSGLAPLVALGLLALWSARSLRGALAGAAVASLALASAFASARFVLLAQAPRLTACLWIGLGLACVSSAARWPRAWARWYVAATLLRVALVTQPAFACIDCSFQHHRYVRFQHARRITSDAPGPSHSGFAVPYPPGLYAALRPVYSLVGERAGAIVMRYTILVLEGLAPLLLAAVALAGGASRRAAAAAAGALAVMPEGLLVGAKGIAANAFGASVTIVALWALARRHTPWLVLAAVLALGLLGHVGAALTLAAAVVVFLARSLRDHPSLARRGGLALVIAAALAWSVYYREVFDVVSSATRTLAASAAATGPEGWGVRWFRVGKAVQDLLLKFGGAPLILARLAWRRGALPSRLHRLSTSWLLVAGLAGCAACVTPFPLRFEYFALPAVALLAGTGAEECERDGRDGWAQAALALALAVQFALGVALVEGRFDPINVILESPRWPLRDQVFAALFGA